MLSLEYSYAPRYSKTTGIPESDWIRPNVRVGVDARLRTDRITLGVLRRECIAVTISVLVKSGLCVVVLARESQVVEKGSKAARVAIRRRRAERIGVPTPR